MIELIHGQATMGDIEILFDVCWILSPSQIQKLIGQYHNADYEAPISSDILKAVAARVKPDDKSDHLLLTPETDEVGPYQLPSSREIAGLETCKWTWTRTRAGGSTTDCAVRCARVAERPAGQAVGDACLVEARRDEATSRVESSEGGRTRRKMADSHTTHRMGRDGRERQETRHETGLWAVRVI
jgi:myosin-5